MLTSSAINKINKLIETGYENRQSSTSETGSALFLKAWEFLAEFAPETYRDFTEVVAAYNQNEDAYDWNGWIWEVVEELGHGAEDSTLNLDKRLHFIESFQERFPETSDESLMEYLQRFLIKTYFLLHRDAEGTAAVEAFYNRFDYSVWGYIAWADALLQRTETPTEMDKLRALEIYKQGLTVQDDPEFLDILQNRIEKLENQRNP